MLSNRTKYSGRFAAVRGGTLSVVRFMGDGLNNSILVVKKLSLKKRVLLRALSRHGSVYGCTVIRDMLVVPSGFACSVVGPTFKDYCNLVGCG